MKARDYIFGGMQKIPGYLEPNDALVYAALLEAQNKAGLGGGAVEIGVFYGRSYYLIRRFLAPGEVGLAIDLFKRGGPEKDQGQIDAFLGHGRRLRLPVDEAALVVGRSTDVTAEEILEKTGPVRFFSIDGSHYVDDVRHDIALADRTLAEHGVIAFDDFCNYEFPDVTAATLEFLRDRAGDYAAIAATPKKLYVARTAHAERYAEAIRKSAPLRRLGIDSETILGKPFLVLRHGIGTRLKYRALQKLRLSQLAGGLY